VEPAPVGVDDNLGGDSRAASRLCASLHRQTWVGFRLVGSHLLAADEGQEGETGKSY
jgi:hypothetical protein